jgi:succinate dehydrogenase/fumarate reductase flavoprotein subunit
MPPAKFKETIEKYNASGNKADVTAGVFARGKRPALERGPYYALGPVKNYINFTDGGLVINERLQVLDANAIPIPRLFAAGATGQGGLPLRGHGNHIGWIFTSGRLAGKYAATLTQNT